MGKKRGQITVFMIIGIIILLTYFLLSHYKKESLEEREQINPEFIPVQRYVESCTESLAREAVEIIGVNGGYVHFPQWIDNDKNSYLQLSPIKELKNPYWWYGGKSSIPPLDFIAEQIALYTKNSIAACINSFSPFKSTYEIVEHGNYEVIAEIGEEDITVKTIFPIEIKDKFNKTLAELQKYIVNIPIRLKKVYQLALGIMERENKDYFIERKVIDLMALDDDGIPTTGMEIYCGRKRWKLEDVEKRLKQLIQINLPYIKIKNTGFSEDSRITPYQLHDTNPYEDSSSYKDSYYGHHYIWDIGDIRWDKMHVSFNYQSSWPMELYARPSNGKYLEASPETAGKMLSMLCFHLWHFTYDVIFPVRTTIVDEKTEENERYSFTFAFKAQINHNQPDRTNFNIAQFDTTRTAYLEEEYCADLRNEITIYAIDKVTQNEIRDVNITFTCGRFACSMGSTKSYWAEDPSGIPKLKTRFPYCSNAVIKGSKVDYESGKTFIQTGRRLNTRPEEQIGNVFGLEMTPIKLFNYSVIKHRMDGRGIGGPLSLEPEDSIMITVRSGSFESYTAYPIEEQAPLKLLAKEDLSYSLEIFLISNKNITGGYKKTAWHVQWDSAAIPNLPAKLAKNITFHVIEKEFRDEGEQYEFFAGLESYSEKVPEPAIR